MKRMLTLNVSRLLVIFANNLPMAMGIRMASRRRQLLKGASAIRMEVFTLGRHGTSLIPDWGLSLSRAEDLDRLMASEVRNGGLCIIDLSL